ncbi:hypothetical protein VTJ04DRAFT_537 [Mycothermus thermophilus]|uniref:uncharacterized protein n=1 Tax=Humicola insolens TaxID=85995 RepID=UPI003743F3E9
MIVVLICVETLDLPYHSTTHDDDPNLLSSLTTVMNHVIFIGDSPNSTKHQTTHKTKTPGTPLLAIPLTPSSAPP